MKSYKQERTAYQEAEDRWLDFANDLINKNGWNDTDEARQAIIEVLDREAPID